MRRIWTGSLLALAALVAVAAVSSAGATLTVGSKAPDFTTRGAKAGRVFALTLSDTLKQGPVVLYFFPAAFTPGCTAEAHGFAEASDDFTKAGATIIGMSADPVDKLARFSREECRDKFAVASAGPAIVKDYGVALFPGLGRTSRTSYVIAPNGRIAFVHSDLDYRNHVEKTLAAVRAMNSKSR